MQIRLSLKLGQKGTKRLLDEYGDRLVCVRYRYDEQTGKRYKTAEVIIAETDWQPRSRKPPGSTIVGVRVGWRESELQQALRAAGGRWNPTKRMWEVRYDRVEQLGLEDRLVQDLGI